VDEASSEGNGDGAGCIDRFAIPGYGAPHGGFRDHDRLSQGASSTTTERGPAGAVLV
jgi:hypothetical protein